MPKNSRVIGIYKITSPTGRVYIGQSTHIRKRLLEYKRLDCKRQTRIYLSLKKYGSEAHIFDVIEECSPDVLNEREKYWQEYYNVTDEHKGMNCFILDSTVNIHNPGSAYVRRVVRRGKDHFNYGRRHSEETKRLLSSKKKGKPNPLNSRKRSKQEVLNMMAGRKKFLYGLDNPSCKIILDTYTGIFYYGVKDAAIAKNIPYSSLKKMICNNRPNNTTLIYV